MLRINAVNLKQEPDNKPSPLFTLFSSNDFRDITSLIAVYASADDLSQVKMSNKAAYYNINKWLDQCFNHPVRLLEVLGKLDKLQIARLLQKYFSPGSAYLENLEHHLDHDSAPVYACYALVANINDLEVEDLESTLEWMRNERMPQHLISSVALILDYLDPPENEDGQELDLDEIIRSHPLAYMNLRGADLHGEFLQDLDLRGANLQHTNLASAMLRRSSLSGASLQHADMTHCNAFTANFSDANLQFAKLDDAFLQNANFNHADLRYASLRYADLSYATLNHATLQGASFKRAKLVEADAIQADLSKANLSSANLQFANLSHASLRHAKLAGAAFFSTDLSHAGLQHTIEKPSFMAFTRFTPDNEGEKPSKSRKLF